MTTMTVVKLRPALAEIKSLLSADKDFLKPLVRTVLQEVLEAEMTEALGASKGERAEGRLGYRSGHYSRSLVTRMARSSSEYRRTVRGGSRPSCLSATSARRRR